MNRSNADCVFAEDRTRDEREPPAVPSASEETPSTASAAARPADNRRARAFQPNPPPATLTEAIEAEREELLQIQAMARCLYEVLLYSDDDDGAMHADVAQVIARLLRDTVSRLELIATKFGSSAAA